jgi:hypothetical protein
MVKVAGWLAVQIVGRLDCNIFKHFEPVDSDSWDRSGSQRQVVKCRLSHGVG